MLGGAAKNSSWEALVGTATPLYISAHLSPRGKSSPLEEILSPRGKSSALGEILGPWGKSSAHGEILGLLSKSLAH